MIKIFTVLATSLFALSVNAFQDWRLDEVKNRDNTVGYVYHTEAIGTQTGNYPSKVSASLRLVCSFDNNPIVVIFWDGNSRYENLSLTATVDNRQLGVGESLRWVQDGKTIYRHLNESANLVQGLKTGKAIKFQWTAGDSSTKTVVFSLYGINFADFNAKCRTQL